VTIAIELKRTIRGKNKLFESYFVTLKAICLAFYIFKMKKIKWYVATSIIDFPECLSL
jgi:hypothetical protein